MSTNVLRASGSWWVLRDGRAARVPVDAPTTAELLAERKVVDAVAAGPDESFDTDAAALEPESPVTAPCRVVAQMVNYRSHARESGFDPDRIQPTFFRKASGSIVGPTSAIVTPAHVRLLDYEVELGLVIGAPVPVGTTVTEATLGDYVAGLVVVDDVSARDVQLSKGQFYESKSYPTFTPVGPYLTLLEDGELSRLVDLRLQLSVDGVLRQDRTLADMIHPPAPSLTALARFQALEPGDLVVTGTPGGTALQAPPRLAKAAAGLLPEELRWRLFFRSQERRTQYLRPGNRVTATIRTADGQLDLGTQDCLVEGAS